LHPAMFVLIIVHLFRISQLRTALSRRVRIRKRNAFTAKSKPVHLVSRSTAFLIHLAESDSLASRATFHVFNTSTLACKSLTFFCRKFFGRRVWCVRPGGMPGENGWAVVVSRVSPLIVDQRLAGQPAVVRYARTNLKWVLGTWRYDEIRRPPLSSAGDRLLCSYPR
jgi:hypothetical protein